MTVEFIEICLSEERKKKKTDQTRQRRRLHPPLPPDLHERPTVVFSFSRSSSLSPKKLTFWEGSLSSLQLWTSTKKMAVIAAPPTGLRRIPVFHRANLRRSTKRLVFSAMKEESLTSKNPEEKEEILGPSRLASVAPQLEKIPSQPSPVVKAPQIEISSSSSTLRFNRLQPLEEECACRHKRSFGRFIAREALIDEEYWTAAWLRAESHWEDRPNVRYVDNFKKQFAEQEFNALKRRCKQHSEKCICFVAVKNDERNSKRNVLSSIVGTLDLSIRHLLCGETFPGERTKAPAFCNIYQADQPRYGYVANLCVSKYARRQGIASNMLLLALEAAASYGANQIFVHVHQGNMAARKLYDLLGFEIVEMATPHLSSENMYLLSLKAGDLTSAD